MGKSEIEKTAESYKVMNSGIRYGQSIMLGLFMNEPEIYNKITGTDADPFHDDDKMPAFWAKYEELTKHD